MKKSNRNLSWTSYTDNLKDEITTVDNELEKSIVELGLFSQAHTFGLRKSKGVCLKQTLFSMFYKWKIAPSKTS